MATLKPKIGTMKELSQAIGVSRPTLSRFFQDPKTVSPATSEKIKERLQKVDYVYNFIATRQNRKSSGLIGVIIPHYKDMFFTSLLVAIENAAKEAGLPVITQSSDGTADGEIQSISRLRSMNAAGAIIAPLGLESSTEAFQMARDDFPIVFVDSRPLGDVEETDFVGTDNSQSIASIVEYLFRVGENPVFLGMPRLNSNSIEREEAYMAAMRKLELEPRFVTSTNTLPSWEFEAFGYDAMDYHFSRQKHTSDTILCANDRIAIGAIRAANKHGLFKDSHDRPNRLRIAGHDNHPLSRYMFPAVTTVAQDITGIGEEAVRLLGERIRGERDSASHTTMMEAVLKLRESA